MPDGGNSKRNDYDYLPTLSTKAHVICQQLESSGLLLVNPLNKRLDLDYRNSQVILVELIVRLPRYRAHEFAVGLMPLFHFLKTFFFYYIVIFFTDLDLLCILLL